MAKFSKKVGGKEVGAASTYAKPHTMTGKSVKAEVMNETGKKVMDDMNIAAGNISKGNYKPEKTSGIKVRGTGAATKGLMARGPMA
jgi:hypothetical protein